MSLSVKTGRHVKHGLASRSAGAEVVAAVDAGTGTLSAFARRRLQYGALSVADGSGIATQIDAGDPLSARQVNALAFAIGSRVAAAEIQAALTEE